MSEAAEVLLKAKRYSNIKYGLAIAGIIYLLCLLFTAILTGASGRLELWLISIVPGKWLVMPLFLLVSFLVYYLLNFPLNLYHSYILEHKFLLSNQRFFAWLSDQVKNFALSYFFSLILVSAFYFALRNYPKNWWWAIWLFWVFFNVILARLLPVVIIPLFFKYKKLEDESLKERIIRLAERLNIRVLGVFEIDFSKKTSKANAAFAGWGKARRVILADTLKDKYTHEEIEVILAHEFAHYKLRHLLKLILINSLFGLICSFVIFKTDKLALDFLGLASLSSLAALPLVIIYLLLIGIIMQPLEAFASRAFERNADRMAIRVTGLKDHFITMLDKLAAQNLADRSVPPLIKFFFYDHPPIEERLKMARLLPP